MRKKEEKKGMEGRERDERNGEKNGKKCKQY